MRSCEHVCESSTCSLRLTCSLVDVRCRSGGQSRIIQSERGEAGDGSRGCTRGVIALSTSSFNLRQVKQSRERPLSPLARLVHRSASRAVFCVEARTPLDQKESDLLHPFGDRDMQQRRELGARVITPDGAVERYARGPFAHGVASTGREHLETDRAQVAQRSCKRRTSHHQRRSGAGSTWAPPPPFNPIAASGLGPRASGLGGSIGGGAASLLARPRPASAFASAAAPSTGYPIYSVAAASAVTPQPLTRSAARITTTAAAPRSSSATA